MLNVIKPDWPAPSHVQAFTTTRQGGISQGLYAALNLGLHVNDQTEHVLANRALLRKQLPSEPVWLEQVHGTTVVPAQIYPIPPIADAVYSHSPQQVCAVQTADCLPLLLCDQAGTHVAAVHAGWRGLAAGIIEQTLAVFADPQQLLAWLGPAIGPNAFEVGAEVREQFIDAAPEAIAAFRPSPRAGHWFADLYQLARQRLRRHGVTQIFGGIYCTYTERELFYSYRRDGAHTGRMASLIWLNPQFTL